jgi:lysophospholipase L1-like esterase
MRRRDLLLGATATAAGLSMARAAPPEIVADPLGVSVPQYPATVPGMAQPAWTPEEERLHTDWAWLACYRADDEAVRALPQAARRVVFMGDSITKVWRDARPDFFMSNGFVGRGIGGQVTAQMLVRFWQDVVALKPLAVHINGGTNDIAENAGLFDPDATRSAIAAMAELARGNGIRVVLSSITPAGDYRWRRGLDPRTHIPQMNAWLAAYAKAQGFVFADYAAVLDDGRGAMKPYTSYDGVHPTPAGYALMEPVALTAVAKALSSG